ncbi:hypothetical protein PMN64_20310, partial [Bradyrhizobium sp. UFLA01-814]
MLTVYGEGRGFRVVWLLEELGLAYRLRPVDLLAAGGGGGGVGARQTPPPKKPKTQGAAGLFEK